jgi:ABC-2 type transport system permease protein
VRQLLRGFGELSRAALSISRKDVESYYGKPPLVTWGLLFPAVLILAVYIKDPDGYLSVAPGIIAMTLLFGNTSMAAIVVTFEKRSGTLERLLLAPVSARTVVLGKGLSAAAYGLATSLVLTAGLVFLLGMPVRAPAPFAAGLLLGAATFSLLGIIASVMVREVFEAMTLMNFFRFPLLFVSGVFVPLGAMPGWSRPLAFASPLTHVAELVRTGTVGGSVFGSAWTPAAAAFAWLAASWLAAGPAFKSGSRR